MTDYSETLIRLTSLIKQYRRFVLKNEFEFAADIAVDIQILARDLQEWTEDQCIEIQNS